MMESNLAITTLCFGCTKSTPDEDPSFHFQKQTYGLWVQTPTILNMNILILLLSAAA